MNIEVAIAAVQDERVGIDGLEGIVVRRHERFLRVRGIEKVPGIQGVRDPGGRIRALVRPRIIGDARKPEVLL